VAKEKGYIGHNPLEGAFAAEHFFRFSSTPI